LLREVDDVIADNRDGGYATALARAGQILMAAPMVDANDLARAPRLLRRLGRDDPSRVLQQHLQPSWLHVLAPFQDPALAQQAVTAARTQAPAARRLSLALLASRVPDKLRREVVSETIGLLDEPPQRLDNPDCDPHPPCRGRRWQRVRGPMLCSHG
jgi:hypothetical protein